MHMHAKQRKIQPITDVEMTVGVHLNCCAFQLPLTAKVRTLGGEKDHGGSQPEPEPDGIGGSPRYGKFDIILGPFSLLAL